MTAFNSPWALIAVGVAAFVAVWLVAVIESRDR